MNCARDRLLVILAERAASVHGLADADRPQFVATCVSEWRSALWDAYAGEEVRFGLRRPPNTREARNARILAAIAGGCPAAAVARRENVSIRLVQVIRQRAQVPA